MSTFKINKEKDVQKSNEEELQEQETLFYTIFGKHEWLDEEGFPRTNQGAVMENCITPLGYIAKELPTNNCDMLESPNGSSEKKQKRPLIFTFSS